MADDIVVYMPVFNCAPWCERVPLPEGLRYVASDNGSTDGSAQILRRRGVEVIEQPVNLGRIGNWRFCVRHFVDSGATWMKWLFSGDVLAPGLAQIAARAIQTYPEARMIVGDNIHVDGDVRAYYKVLPETRLLQPREGVRLLAEMGNWFYSPINQMFHRQALADGFDYGSFDWAADVYFCLGVASRFPVLYWAESFGEFQVAERKHFSTQRDTLRAIIEDALVRENAAAAYGRMGQHGPDVRQMSDRIEADLLRRLLSRRLSRSRAGAGLLAFARAARGLL